MPSIFAPSSAKCITTQVLLIAKLNERKNFILRDFACDIIRPSGELPIQSLRARIRCENCSKLRIKTLERCQLPRSSVFIVNCEHISNFVLIVDFEQANICWVHIEETNSFEDKIRYIMRYVVLL